MDLGDVADKPFGVLVEYQVRTENNSVAEWLDVWNHRGEDARTGEPETAAYAAAINVDDGSNVVVFERYRHGQTSLKQHMDRPAHATLIETMGERRMTKRRVMTATFTEMPDYGWWSRPGTVETSPQGVILVALGFRFGSPEQLATFQELSQTHALYCQENEPDTLIYGAGIATADADREIDLRKDDVVFIMACTDMAAVDKHANDPRHVALFPRLAELGVELERTFMRTYRTTGNGFLWREAE